MSYKFLADYNEYIIRVLRYVISKMVPYCQGLEKVIIGELVELRREYRVRKFM